MEVAVVGSPPSLIVLMVSVDVINTELELAQWTVYSDRFYTEAGGVTD